MNAKTCKSLRRAAREITAGRPERMLVQYRQNANPVYDPTTGKMVPRSTICAVNAPGTTRYVYRNLKSGRTIDPNRILQRPQTAKPDNVTHVADEKSIFSKITDKVTAWYRKFFNK